MADRVIKRLGRLARKRPSRGIGDRAGDDYRQSHAAALECFFNRKEGRLGVQRVEHRFHEQEIDAALEQAVDRLAVRPEQPLEIDGAKTGIVDVRRDRPGLVRRPEHAGNEARPLRRARLPLAGGFARQLGAGAIHFARQALHAIVGKGDRRGIEGVRLDDVGARLQVLRVDVADQPRLGERQEVVMTAQLARPVAKAHAAVVLLGEPRALDHGAHRAVEQHDAATQQRGQGGGMRGNGYHGAPAKKPVQLCAKRAFRRVSLAAFVTRPQAEHQIGAMRGSLPTPSQCVNRAAYNPPRS